MPPGWIVKLDHCYPFEEGLDWAAKVRLAQNRTFGHLQARTPGGEEVFHVSFNDTRGLVQFLKSSDSPPLRPTFIHRPTPPETTVELYWDGWPTPLEVSEARTLRREDCFLILDEYLKTAELPPLLPSREPLLHQPLFPGWEEFFLPDEELRKIAWIEE